jgi:hypothetical protein
VKGRSLLWSSLVGLAAIAPVPAMAGSAIAVISVTPTKDGIQIVGQALAMVDAKISGELSISRKGQAGSVTTKQGGELSIQAGRTGDVARVGVSYQKGDLLDVVLILKQDGVVISETTLKTGEE